MRLIPNQNAASSKLTVTSTATLLTTLIDTAGSVTNTLKYLSDPDSNGVGVANGILITPEDGNIRMGNGIVPTSVLGTLLSQGTKYFIPNVTLPSLKLIRVTGDTICSVDFVVCETGDTYSAVAETVAIEGVIIVGGVTIADGADTTQGAKADAKSTATDTTPTSVVSILKEISHMEQNPASRAVTGSVTANAGTNLDTSALALEAGGNLASVKTNTDKIPALGQALAAASTPVVLPADQITTLTPPAAITGFAIETGGNLATVKTNTDNIPAKGNAAMAASTPVTMASDDTLITALKTALELLDNAVDGNYLNANLNVAGTDVAAGSGAQNAQTLRVIAATDDPAVTQLTNLGKSVNGAGAPTITSVGSVNIAAVTGANQVVLAAQGASTQIWVTGYSFTCDTAATTVAFQDEDDTALATYGEGFAQYGGIALAPNGNFAQPLFKVATNKALEVDVATGSIGGIVHYCVASV